MKSVLSRFGWLLTGAAAVALSVGLSFTLRQNQVVGEERAPTATTTSCETWSRAGCSPSAW